MNQEALNITLKSSTGNKVIATYLKHKNKQAPVVIIIPPDNIDLSKKNNIIDILFNSFLENEFSIFIIHLSSEENKNQTPEDVQELFFIQLEDISISLNWLLEEHPDASHFWVASYSYASLKAADLIMRRPEIEAFIFVSPAITKGDKSTFSFLSPTPCPGLLIHGNADNVSKYTDTIKLANFLNEQNLHEIQINIIQDANHIYTNKLKDLVKTITSYIKYRLATRIVQKIMKKRRKRDKKKLIK